MAKTVFRSNEIIPKEKKLMLGLTRQFVVEEEPEEIVEEPQFQGPTADDLRREAEAFKVQWEQEKADMIAAARADADRIRKEAEQAAFDEVKRKTDQAQVIRQQAQDEAADIIKKAEEQAKELAAKTAEDNEQQRRDGYNAGFADGQDKGFAQGKSEADHLVTRLHTLIERTMDRRTAILSETEQQVVNLVLLMATKVVKVLSENQKSVVAQNVMQALRKVKGRGDVTIRVNLADLELTTQHKKEFIAAAENIKNLAIIEDTTVDRGGCIVETDFGEIDARISSQLEEMEKKILEVSPVRTRSRASAS